MTTGNADPNYHGQLTASTVDTITIEGGQAVVEVVNVDGSAKIYYTTDGTTPVVGGNSHCRVLPAAIVNDIVNVNPDGQVIKLISSGTPAYAIMMLAGPAT